MAKPLLDPGDPQDTGPWLRRLRLDVDALLVRQPLTPAGVVRGRVGRVEAVPDASGFVPVTHGLGYVPASIQLTCETSLGHARLVTDSLDDEGFTVQCTDLGGALVSGVTVAFHWVALS